MRSYTGELEQQCSQAVLVESGGDVERAINMLLEMNDPNSKPPQDQQLRDEALARDLADAEFAAQLQEQERQQAAAEYAQMAGQGQQQESQQDDIDEFKEIKEKMVAVGENVKQTVVQASAVVAERAKGLFDKLKTTAAGTQLGMAGRPAGPSKPVATPTTAHYQNLPDNELDSLISHEDEPLVVKKSNSTGPAVTFADQQDPK
ncbi:hypothetical protein HK102_002894 [Quaeritorhiza haematococci]|nr:hypothetical protein HK102_002894 [Quaeritorhiza haematococci]